MTGTPVLRRENWLLPALFLAALAAHFGFATANWNSGFLPGHEFRQTQTAIVSYYIDQQDNFSLRYETPLFGKPWVALPLEVPFYEWSVVLLSRATGLPHFKAARGISLACFYLALPALYLLLGRMGLPRPRRLLALALVLACPVYIFYSRAFLMDSMEMMGCAWFLACYVRMMDRRHWGWLAATTVAGTGAALIKNTTYAVWLVPAAAYAAWALWRDWRAGRGWDAVLRTAAWGLGGVIVSLILLSWWIAFSDAIKAAHSGGDVFTSKGLATGNYGLFDLGVRLSPATWGILLERWADTIMAPWMIGLVVLAGLVLPTAKRWWIAALAGLFLFAQAFIPFAYAYQDYYFYACSVFLMLAFAYVLYGVLDSRLPGWACALVIAAPFAGLYHSYWQGYRPQQLVVSNGGTGLTDALRDIAPKDAVFVIAGADWAAIVPYYSQHKALMIRNGLENDAAYLDRAFADLDDEDVAGVILMGNQRNNRDLLERVMAKFHVDSIPTFSHPSGDVYFTRFYRSYVISYLKSSNPYDQVTLRQDEPIDGLDGETYAITPGMARSSFKAISPGPFRARFGYGFKRVLSEGDMVISAHPDTDLWLHAPAQASTIQWDYGMHASSYEREGAKTEGVIFIITGESADGRKREIYRRLIDPVHNPEDRGRQHEIIPYQPRPNETLVFSTRPNRGYAYGWAYWLRIVVK